MYVCMYVCMSNINDFILPSYTGCDGKCWKVFSSLYLNSSKSFSVPIVIFYVKK